MLCFWLSSHLLTLEYKYKINKVFIKFEISMQRRVSPPKQAINTYNGYSRSPLGRPAVSQPYLEPYYPPQPNAYNDSYRLQSALYRKMNRSPPTRENNLYAPQRSNQTALIPYKGMSRSPPANTTALSLYNSGNGYRTSPVRANSMELYQTRRAYRDPYQNWQGKRNYYNQYPQYPSQYGQYSQYNRYRQSPQYDQRRQYGQQRQYQPYRAYPRQQQHQKQYQQRALAPITYAQPSNPASRSYMYSSAQPIRRDIGYQTQPKTLKKRKYNQSRVSNQSNTSYNSYNSYGSSLNNTRRRIEYRQGYKKKQKTSICTPCCLGVLGLLLLLALLAGLYFLIRELHHDDDSSHLKSERGEVDYIGTRKFTDLQTGEDEQNEEQVVSIQRKDRKRAKIEQKQIQDEEIIGQSDVSPIIITDYGVDESEGVNLRQSPEVKQKTTIIADNEQKIIKRIEKQGQRSSTITQPEIELQNAGIDAQITQPITKPQRSDPQNIQPIIKPQNPSKYFKINQPVTQSSSPVYYSSSSPKIQPIESTAYQILPPPTISPSSNSQQSISISPAPTEYQILPSPTSQKPIISSSNTVEPVFVQPIISEEQI